MTNTSSEIFTRNLANYDTGWSVAEYLRDVELYPIERDLLERHFPPPPARVLDLGCGGGRTTGALARRGYAPIGIDLSEALIEGARGRHPDLDFRVMDATTLAFDDASFDAVLFSYNGIDCIYPESGRLRCMREAYRVLKPGGMFQLGSHNFIGALFSGGWFYLPGYRGALRMLAQQRGNPAMREWFARYTDGGGDQFLYSAPPGRTVDQLRGVGFEVADICGGTVQGGPAERRPRRVLLHQQHVHFMARKPG